MNKAIVLTSLCLISLVDKVTFGFGEKTFFTTRSQSVNAVRELVGWQHAINRPDSEHMYAVFSITTEYSRSFRDKKIAEALFGCSTLVFSGSRNGDRGENDILADYFGLPSDFKSVLSITPRITNFVVDFNWYHGLDACVPGLFYRVHVPMVHTKWDLNLCECEHVINAGTRFNTNEPDNPAASYPAGYLGPDRILLDDLPRSIQQALEGKTTFGDMRKPLQYGKVFGRQIMTRVSDIQCALGWNFYRSDWYHAGLSLRFAIPAGNRSSAEFLFEPMIGNGGHWEFGAGFTGHVQLCQSEDERQALALYCDANITHLFSAKQKRSFDFTNNGNGSRYILMEEIASPSLTLFTDNAGNDLAQNQYLRRLVPAINETTLDILINIAIQADIVLKLAYQCENLEIDFGYNFYGRSKEKFCRCEKFESDRFGLKGDAQLYGFTAAQVAVPLNATQSNATIKAGQDDGNADFRNFNADNPAVAFTAGGGVLDQLTAADATALGIAADDVRLSNPAILLKDEDLNICSGLLPRATSHKIFAHINYEWLGYDDFIPYLGGGAAVEWSTCRFRCDSGLSQWGIWFKGGISY
ncbi:MAG: hypothetical protein Q8Q25_02955 [bacterium]|nr:hypothetical protein [bacterium]